MIRKKTILIGLTVISMAIWSCSKSNEETEWQKYESNTGGNTNCDTVNMQYTADVLPIIQANCYSCHGNGLSQNGVSLDSYEKVKLQADNGNLINVITHADGYPPMPQGAPKLSDCNINKIRSWINHGALNN